jgi:hypothetical protein
MRKPGKYIQITEGVHAGKQGIAYNREQEPAIIKAGKVAVWIPVDAQGSLFETDPKDWKKVLFTPDKLRIIAFID